jgi:deoxyribodipyrimidine photo-lyase
MALYSLPHYQAARAALLCMSVQLLWFKRDLRVEDHAPLAHAAERGAVLPLFIIEPELWQQPDMAGRHWAFVAESLHELQKTLAALGQSLVVMYGDVVAVLAKIHADIGIAALWSHEETGNGWTYARDIRVAAWLREKGIAWHEARQTGVVRRLKSRNGWAQAWDRQMAQPMFAPPEALAPLPYALPQYIPSAKDMQLAPDACPKRQRGGSTRAFHTLHSFCEERGRDYRVQMSSPVTAFNACSRLSPHLAWGTLSMREVAQTSWARMRALNAQEGAEAVRWRGALSSFTARQHWHCHFIQKLEDEPRLEFHSLHPAYAGVRPEPADATKLAAWAAGETGFPFIDACMRALQAHGWINFRMRAMLMSFASYQLWLPWRASGLHLARLFTDYEPGIHWPQVQMQSGTTGINTMRIYNPIKQSYDQDPYGLFIRNYLPELEAVPDAFLHEPWRWEGCATVLDTLYPAPIVDNASAMKAAREALYAIRKNADHRIKARAIVQKHGSRKAGVKHANPRTTPRKPADEPMQLGFDL